MATVCTMSKKSQCSQLCGWRSYYSRENTCEVSRRALVAYKMPLGWWDRRLSICSIDEHVVSIQVSVEIDMSAV